jgi:hypothetical protein
MLCECELRNMLGIYAVVSFFFAWYSLIKSISLSHLKQIILI